MLSLVGDIIHFMMPPWEYNSEYTIAAETGEITLKRNLEFFVSDIKRWVKHLISKSVKTAACEEPTFQTSPLITKKKLWSFHSEIKATSMKQYVFTLERFTDMRTRIHLFLKLLPLLFTALPSLQRHTPSSIKWKIPTLSVLMVLGHWQTPEQLHHTRLAIF